MSRTSLHRPRPSRAVCCRPAPDTRLLPIPPHPNTHNKRCPKAQRQNLRSDQSPSRPLNGRSPDRLRHALIEGPCQVCAPLTRRKAIAASGDAPEHGVIVLPRAIAPPRATAPLSDSPGIDRAGESEQSEERRLKTNAPYMDSTVVTTGELRSTNGGHGSPLPSLGMVEHFWWTRLPHAENISGFVHILSEVRGCRRVDVDVKRPQGRTPNIAAGVADFSHKQPGPSNPTPQSLPAVPNPSFSITSSPAGVPLVGTLPGAEPLTLRPVEGYELGVADPTPDSQCHSDAPRGIWGGVLSPFPPSTELEGDVAADAATSPSVLLSHPPLMAPRERETKAVRVPTWGWIDVRLPTPIDTQSLEHIYYARTRPPPTRGPTKNFCRLNNQTRAWMSKTVNPPTHLCYHANHDNRED